MIKLYFFSESINSFSISSFLFLVLSKFCKFCPLDVAIRSGFFWFSFNSKSNLFFRSDNSAVIFSEFDLRFIQFSNSTSIFFILSFLLMESLCIDLSFPNFSAYTSWDDVILLTSSLKSLNVSFKSFLSSSISFSIWSSIASNLDCKSSNWSLESFNSLDEFVSTSRSSFSVFKSSPFSFDILFSFKSASKEILFSRSRSDSTVLIDFSSFSCNDLTLPSSSTRLDMSKLSFCNLAALSIFLSLRGASFLFSSSSWKRSN